MTHLTRAESKGLFETSVPERPDRENGHDSRMGLMPSIAMEEPFAVSIATTPDQARKLRMANFPEYTWPSVSNLNARVRGKHY